MSRSRSAHALSRPAVPRHARRVSGPVPRPRPVPVPGQPRRRTPVAQPHSTFGATLRALPDHRLLDTLLRSRAWIWLLGIALGGIVFMQVSLLGMNAGIGRSVAQSTTLEHENAQLQETVAELADGDRVRDNATLIGLIAPDATDVQFLKPHPALDARNAASRMGPPSDEARAALGTGGKPSTTTAAATTTTAVAPAATVAPVATAAPVTTAATPVPTAAAPVATTAPPVATTAPTTPTTASAGGATAAP